MMESAASDSGAMDPETIGLIGFVLLLAGWFGMFVHVRRDHPNHPLSRYRTYIGPRLSGVRMSGRSGFSLIPFYWRHYGADAPFIASVAGLVLVATAAVFWAFGSWTAVPPHGGSVR